MWTGLSLDGWWMVSSLKNRAAVAFAMFFVFFQIFVIIMWLSIYPNPGSWPPLVGENRSTCSSTSNNFEYPNISYIHTNHNPLENLFRQRCYLWIFRSDARTNVPATSTRSWQWGLLMGVQGQRTVLVMGNSFMKQVMIWWEDWRLDTHVMFPFAESWPNFFVVLRYCKLPCRVIFIS